MLFINGLEVAILGVKPDACTKRRMWNLSDLEVSGPGSCSLAALKAGPTCCAIFVPNIGGTVVLHMALWEDALIDGNVASQLLFHPCYHRGIIRDCRSVARAMLEYALR